MTGRRKTQKGQGIGDVLNFIRDQKLISKGLGLIPHPGAQVASQIAGLVGLGRKRKAKKKKMTGKGIFGDIGGGIGSIFGGLGSGVGSIAHGLFGGSKRKRTVLKL